MRLVVVRHTAVDVPMGVCYGHLDVALAQSSDDDIKRVSDILRDYSFDAVYSSPLLRCTKLAEVFSDGVGYVSDKRLMELNFGRWEGCDWEDISDTQEAQFWFADWINGCCLGGESYLQLSSRVKEFLKDIKRIHRNKTVLVVTHGGVIRALHCLINKVDIEDVFNIKVEYGNYIEFEIVENVKKINSKPII